MTEPDDFTLDEIKIKNHRWAYKVLWKVFEVKVTGRN